MNQDEPLKELLNKLSDGKGKINQQYVFAGNKLKNLFLRDYARMLHDYYEFSDADTLKAILDLDQLVEDGKLTNEIATDAMQNN